MNLMKTLPALLASLAILPVQAQADGVGRMDQSAAKQLAVDLKSCAKPVWPQESLRREETGRVTLEYLIGLDGKVLESKVIKSSGFPLLDLAAQDGLAKCQFALPSTVGRTEPTRTRMQYLWTLEDSKSPTELLAEWQALLKAAEQGDGEAQAKVGKGYLTGRSHVGKNAEEGLRWLRASAEQGNVHGIESLALELKTGRNVPADEHQALALLEKAVALGSSNAELGLAMMLMGPKSVAPDEARARALLEKAVAAGHKVARMPLVYLLLKEGDTGKEEALRQLHAAADELDRTAVYTLAAFYEKGEHVAVDRAKALALYERAAAAGMPLAQAAVTRLKQQAGK